MPLTGRNVGIVVPQELFASERLESLQDPVSNPTAADGTDDFSFEVKRVSGNVGDIPFARPGLIVGGNKVSYEDENRHEDMLGD